MQNTFFGRLAGEQFTDCITCFTAQKFYFGFHRQLRFCLFTHLCFTMYVYVLIPMFRAFLPSFYPSVLPQAQSRAILLHCFSRLAGAQFTVCMIYFTLQTFLFCFPQTIAFSPHHLCLTLNTSEHTLLLCFMHL